MKAAPRIRLTSSEIVAALTACGIAAAEARRRHRRRRLGHAIHELRRPLQALLLTPEPAERSLTAVDLALAALHDLESVLDGGQGPPRGARIAAASDWQQLLDGAAGRWRQAAWLRGGRIIVDCRIKGGGPLAHEIAISISRALDNLILNSLTHGGATIRVGVSRHSAGVELTVSDSGNPPASDPARRPGRHGQGLRVVAGIAGRLGGSFKLDRGDAGSLATIRLPLPQPREPS